MTTYLCPGCLLVLALTTLCTIWLLQHAPEEPYPGAWGPLE